MSNNNQPTENGLFVIMQIRDCLRGGDGEGGELSGARYQRYLGVCHVMVGALSHDDRIGRYVKTSEYCVSGRAGS